MRIARRRLFAAALAGLGLPPPAIAGAAGQPAFLSAGMARDGRALDAALGLDGATRWRHDLPARAHQVIRRPAADETIAFGRRPGGFMMVLGLADGRRRHLVEAAAGRHFNGHGVFDATGGLLYATETEIDSGDGRIGIYDARQAYRRVGEVPSGGLDPHDVRLMPDGTTLVVANGGILTHPDLPQGRLNPGDMAPSIAYLALADGRIVEQVAPPSGLSQLSLRHLAVTADGLVEIAGQYEGPQADPVPLVASHRRGADRLTFLNLDDHRRAGLRQYCGSAALDRSGAILGATSPRGGLAVFWRVADGTPVGQIAAGDVCGIAAGPEAGSFVLTSGLGGAWMVWPAQGKQAILAGADAALRWDNHLTHL
ncbi:MAG: DUF1513 domain-containing protein [Ferrovibrionaceae bacterium]